MPKHRMSIDRFEGDKKQIAVLVTEDGEHQVNVPKQLLPKGSKAGDVLMMEFGGDAAAVPRSVSAAGDMTATKDDAATKDVAERTKKLQKELKKRDTGGDIEL